MIWLIKSSTSYLSTGTFWTMCWDVLNFLGQMGNWICPRHQILISCPLPLWAKSIIHLSVNHLTSQWHQMAHFYPHSLKLNRAGIKTFCVCFETPTISWLSAFHSAMQSCLKTSFWPSPIFTCLIPDNIYCVSWRAGGHRLPKPTSWAEWGGLVGLIGPVDWRFPITDHKHLYYCSFPSYFWNGSWFGLSCVCLHCRSRELRSLH